MLESKLRKLKLHENGNCFKLNYKDKMLTFSLGSIALRDYKRDSRKILKTMSLTDYGEIPWIQKTYLFERERERERREREKREERKRN